MVGVRSGGQLRRFFRRLAAARGGKRQKRRSGKGYVSVELPEGLDWEVWRILSSDRFTVSKRELEEEWTLTEWLDAHLTLDLLEDLEAKRYKQDGKQ